MGIPTEKEWRPFNPEDLDAAYAKRQFLGKSYAQAVEMFAENALHYGEDLESMPRIPLNYYAPALAEYITSKNAKEDADGASSYLTRVIWIVKQRAELLSDKTKNTLIAAAKEVLANQDFYDATADIYGSFEDYRVEIYRL